MILRNEDALGGSFPIDFFSEAGAIEDLFEDGTGDWREWSPIATGGEMAALIELISEKKVGSFLSVPVTSAEPLVV